MNTTVVLTSDAGPAWWMGPKGVLRLLPLYCLLVVLLACSNNSSATSDTGSAMDLEEETRIDIQVRDCSGKHGFLSNGLCVPPGMIGIPEGEFMMGCNQEVDWHCTGWKHLWTDDEFPYHVVYLPDFAIDETEVTRKQYSLCVEWNVCDPPSIVSPEFRTSGSCLSATTDSALDQFPDYPVSCITWFDAEDYCKSVGKRLCTEAEWEKAARGADGRMWPWGNLPQEAFDESLYWNSGNCNYAAAYECSPLRHPVGSFPEGVSPYGVLDMAGNVSEMLADWMDSDYYYRSPYSDPPGPTSGVGRVARGGHSSNWLHQTRASQRAGWDPWSRSPKYGFRCCLDISNAD